MKHILSACAVLALCACSESTGPETVPCDPALLTAGTVGRDTVTTGTGLRYVEIRAGTGATAVLGSAVRAHYAGYLVNGTRFDTSCESQRPLRYTLPSSGLIQGFWEGTVGMREGGVRRVIIPPNLGYGANPPSGIPANATLIFDLQLDAILND